MKERNEFRQTLFALFDGSVFRPEQPIEFAPNTRVRMTIETISTVEKHKSDSFLRVARSLKIKGPRDWSSRLEYYLYRK
jgi:hypothetical protein